MYCETVRIECPMKEGHDCNTCLLKHAWIKLGLDIDPTGESLMRKDKYPVLLGLEKWRTLDITG